MMAFPWVWARVWLVAMLSSLAGLASGHEISPAVADVSLGETAEITLDWSIEAPLAGIDLEGLEDTNAAPEADRHDALRALPPEALAAEFRAAWPDIAKAITLRAGDVALSPELRGVEVPEVGNVELARTSRVTLAAPLPPGTEAVVFGWEAALGPLVVRQVGVENGYADFLPAGDLSEPMPVAGGSRQTWHAAFADYVAVGYDHIVPKGLDHILFVLGLFLLSTRMRPLLTQVTAFTLAHTVTLALGATGVVTVSPAIVEPLIAASIIYVGVENLFARELTPWRPAVVFGFGLLHGLGFAGVLRDFGLDAEHFVAKLIGFNVGVELGQLAVIAAAALALGLLFSREPWWRARVAHPVSIAIALIATLWLLERTGFGGEATTLFLALAEGRVPVMMSLGFAVVLGAFATGAALLIESDEGDDSVAAALSFGAFMALLATFTAGEWWAMLSILLVWIVALRLIGPGLQRA